LAWQLADFAAGAPQTRIDDRPVAAPAGSTATYATLAATIAAAAQRAVVRDLTEPPDGHTRDDAG
jgi:O6-methylguanine-DNA--protein-cysteine methyltransferase